MTAKRISFFRSLFSSNGQKPKPASARKPRFEPLESREMLSASGYEAYAWSLVNEMRADPAAFADTLENVYRDNFDSAHGYDSNDPLWDELRDNIDSGNTAHFWEALALMRAQPRLGPLAWSGRLEQISQDHNNWMEDHAYAHSYFEGSSTYPTKFADLPDSWGDLAGINGDYDVINSSVLGDDFQLSWSENIGWSTGESALANLYGNTSTAYRQRLAYVSTIGFMIEVNSSSLGHLKNLLSRDQTSGDTFNLYSGKNKDIGVRNAIGIDFDWHDSGYLVTHTLSKHVYDDTTGGNGGYVAGLVYTDSNNNGYYDVGEGVKDEWTVSQSYSSGGLYFGDAVIALGNDEGIISHYAYNGKVEIEVPDRGQDTSDYIWSDNVWAPFIVGSSGFGLVDPSATSTIQMDLYEPNNTPELAHDLGTVNAMTPFNNGTATLSIHSADDADWFRFQVEDGDAEMTASVLFSDADGDLDVRLLREESDGSLSMVAFSYSMTDNESLAETLPPGTYLLMIDGYGADTNFYSLTLDVDVNTITDPLQFAEGRGLYEAWNGFGVNYRGYNEKYFADAQGAWYAIMPSGDIHIAPWTFADDTVVASIDSMYWQDPNKLFGVVSPQAHNAYQFAHERDLVEQWVGWGIDHRGHDEKYFYSNAEAQWYAILPNGEIHHRRNGWIFNSTSLVTTTSEYYWEDPNRLVYAANPNGLKAYEFSNGQGMYQAWTDWRYNERGYEEKYFRNKYGTVFAILPNGQIHLEASVFDSASFYTALANDYYYDPTLLFVYQ